MLSVTRIMLVVALSLVSVVTSASTNLSNHVMAVSQSMSAFYMYSLSEGDDRYKNEYEKHFNTAETFLGQFHKEDAVSASELQNQWKRLRPALKYDYVDGAGFIIPVTVRNEFRAYLTKAYSKLTNTLGSEMDFNSELFHMGLSVEVMSARFFDISSALYGTMSIANKDGAIDPVQMAKNLNERLERAKQLNIPEAIKRDLRQVQTKWRFIEDSVVNYKDEAAYLLVYFNKSKITKLLNNSQTLMAKA